MGESAKPPCLAIPAVRRKSSTVSRILDKPLLGFVDLFTSWPIIFSYASSSPSRPWPSVVRSEIWEATAKHFPDLILDLIRIARAID